MDPTADELAGVVDLFGALTRSELAEGLAELAFKRGEEYDPDAFAADIDDALRSYHLVAVTDSESSGDESLLVVGPVAFPELPDGATDLPHILDVPDRTVERSAAASEAAARFRDEVDSACENDDEDRLQTLLDVSYELEAWGGVDLSRARTRIDESGD